MGRFKQIKALAVLVIEFFESLVSVKHGRDLAVIPNATFNTKSLSPFPRHAQELEENLTREEFNHRNESIGVFKNLRCFTSRCNHSRTGKDLNARNLSVLTWYYRPVQQGRPGITLKSLAYSLILGEDRQRKKLLIDSGGIAGCYYSDSSNYYHFWCDAIVDAWILYASNPQKAKPSLIIMPFSGKPWQREVLDLCSIPYDKIIGLHQFTEITIKHASIVFRAKGGRASPPWLYQALQDIVKPCLYEAIGYPKRIYSARLNSMRRRLVNEDEVIELMLLHGYTIIDCCNESVANQIKLFRNASHIVAPHGASLTNIAWCKPNTYILDLMPSRHMNPCFFDLARQGGMNYMLFPTMPINSSQDPLDCPVKIDIKGFIDFFKSSPFAQSSP
jgi:hypothetical protein